MAKDKILNKSYEWIARVCQKQERFVEPDTLWNAYPYKRNGLTEEGFYQLYLVMLETVRDM